MAQSELIEELEKGSDPCGGKWGRPLWRKGSDPVTGRQKMLLKEKLNLYKKDDLKVFADDIGLAKLSKLKKAELVERVAAMLLNPDVMFCRMSIFDDRAIEIFEKGIGKFYRFTDDERDIVSILNEMDLAVVGEDDAGEDIVFVFDDVAEVWQGVKNEKFEAYRKRASWVWKCLYWTEEMYGYTPIENFLDVIGVKKEFRMSANELIEIFNRFPLDRLWTVRIGDFFLSTVFDSDDLYDLRARQMGKDFYIPSVAEVEELFNKCALLSTPAYQEMKKYMTKNMHLTETKAEDILLDLWDMLSKDDDFHETMEWFMEQFETKSKKQAIDLLNLLMPLSNNTRRLSNKGHTPSELSSRCKFEPGNMPVITAGSSLAAEMLAEAAPEIRKLGFGLDLESNAANIPVMDLPNGLDGPVKMSQKRVYPNDPCPCGSGKKFKKCCGK